MFVYLSVNLQLSAIYGLEKPEQHKYYLCVSERDKESSAPPPHPRAECVYFNSNIKKKKNTQDSHLPWLAWTSSGWAPGMLATPQHSLTPPHPNPLLCYWCYNEPKRLISCQPLLELCWNPVVRLFCCAMTWFASEYVFYPEYIVFLWLAVKEGPHFLCQRMTLFFFPCHSAYWKHACSVFLNRNKQQKKEILFLRVIICCAWAKAPACLSTF